MTKAAELAKMGEVLTNSQIGGRRNLIINGAMQVAQRGTSTSSVGASSGYFACDRWRLFSTTSGRVTVSQSTDAPNGFANSFKIDVTTADTSIAATELFILSYAMEGQDAQMIKKGTSEAESLTMSFYAKANASANYVVEMYDADNTRNNTQAFTVTDSWQRFSFTFAPDTTGALDNDNALSFYPIQIWLHGGSNYSSGTFASNTWGSVTNANRYAGSRTSIFDSTDREFYVTGVQVEVGSQATPFEHRSFGEELRLCKRYLHQIGTGEAQYTPIGVGNTEESFSNLVIFYPVKMRAVPTLTYDGIQIFDASVNTGITSTRSMYGGTQSANMQLFHANLTRGRGVYCNLTGTSSYMRLDAEL